ncbi:MAG: AAA family ATPase, partial [Patescibacteria group bacterium]
MRSAEKSNLADFLDFETTQVVDKFLQSGKADISALLLPISEMPGCDFILFRIGDNPEKFSAKLREYLKNSKKNNPGDELDLLLGDAFADVMKSEAPRALNWRDLLVTLAARSDFFRNYLFALRLEKKDVRFLADWNWAIELGQQFRKKFWLKENLMRRRGLAKGWSAGFTLNLDRFALDLTEIIAKRGFSPHLYGRLAETESIERILARAGENNAVIVGDPGVGKKTIAQALAKKILDGDTLPSLAHKRVLELDIGAILAGAASEHEVEGRLKAVLNDAVSAGNVILLIDEIHSMFEKNPAPGTVNAAELLLPYLNSSSIQIIGLTTYAGYQGTIAKNGSLLRSFEKVEIHETSKENVFKILEEVVPQIEAHDQVLILYQAMRQAVEMTDRYIKNVPFPEKAISVLQQAAVLARSKRKSSQVTPEDIEEVIHQKTEIPVGKIALAEKEILLDLEKILHRKVIGQEDAILAISSAMRRARSGISSEKKPIGSFLFLGPTGVGKTETAKALASVYFGSEKRLNRFDMSEYQRQDSIHRIIGHDDEGGQLTTAIMENPFSLLLLDEIEKAHPDILNLF